jgi:hypothetical protein
MKRRVITVVIAVMVSFISLALAQQIMRPRPVIPQQPAPAVKPQETPVVKPQAEPVIKPQTVPMTKPLPVMKPKTEADLKLTQDRITRMDDFRKNWRTNVQQKIGDANRKLAMAREQSFQKRLQLQVSTKTLLPIQIPPDMIETRVREMIAKQKTVTSRPGVNISNAMAIPKIIRVTLNLDEEDKIKEGGIIVIQGENYGDSPASCGVAVEFNAEPKESMTTTTPPQMYTVNLIPGAVGAVNWQSSWWDKAILAKVPTDNRFDSGELHGTLVVWRGGQQSFVLRHPVEIVRSGLVINSYKTFPEYNDRVTPYGGSSGGEIWVYGRGFGDNPGAIYLDLVNPIGNMNKIDLKPLVKTWSDSQIHASFPKIPGNYPFQVAKLYIWNSHNNKFVMNPIQFGPKMIYTIISGYSFINLAHPAKAADKDIAQEEGAVLYVSHDPECGKYIGEGNQGDDKFFSDRPLPPNCKVVKVVYSWVNPDTTWDSIKLIANEVLDWIKIMTSFDVVDFFKKIGEYIITGIAGALDPKVGSYSVKLIKNPTETDPEMIVHWENTCAWISENNGIPVKYVTSFMLWGPDGVVPGQIK